MLENGMNNTQAESFLQHRLWLSPQPAHGGHYLCSLLGFLEFLLYDLRVCNGWISIILPLSRKFDVKFVRESILEHGT